MLSRRQIPNLLTYGRMAAAVFCLLVMLFLPPQPALLLWVFVAASLTDFLDGYLARRWNAVSAIGALLDPLADKLIVSLMLIYLARCGLISVFPAAVIILREILITWLRSYLTKKGGTLPVSKGGKIKTSLQLVGIICLLATLAYPLPWLSIPGVLLIWIAAAFAVISAAQYLQASLPYLKKAR